MLPKVAKSPTQPSQPFLKTMSDINPKGEKSMMISERWSQQVSKHNKSKEEQQEKVEYELLKKSSPR